MHVVQIPRGALCRNTSRMLGPFLFTRSGPATLETLVLLSLQLTQPAATDAASNLTKISAARQTEGEAEIGGGGNLMRSLAERFTSRPT